jgi:hypothetical protein
MKASLAQHKSRGQAIPLIAVMLVVLFGMVALAVDVGNTYAEQRNIVRGTNAASLAGMNKYLTGGTDGDVRKAIEQSLISNGVPVTAYGAAPQAGERTITAKYLDASGSVIASCSEVGACGAQKVNGVKYIRVDVSGEVDTYFARLFGTTELPVNSTAFSKLGFCTSGYYPLAVRYSVNGQPTLNDNGFIGHDGFYTDETYPEPLKYKKLYLRDGTNASGGFSLLRWNPTKQTAGNTTHLADMLGGDGNITDGFAEADWPDIPEGPAEYVGYPREPGVFSGNEWVYGNFFSPGTDPFGGPAGAQMQYHKTNRTLLTLPLYRFDNGDLTDPSYYVETLGSFLLLDYGRDATGSFVTLAYIGSGGQCASLETNPPPSSKLTLMGDVAYIPSYRVVNNADRPVQFLVVLDVTGSMSWNFAGQGSIGGSTVSCVSGEVQCTSGPNTAWPNVNERRIKIAKDVLNDFVDELSNQVSSGQRPHDVMRIVTFAGDFGDYVNNNGDTGDNAAAVASLTNVYPASWTADPAVLENAIQQAGSVNGDPYLTDGSTPSAVGLARASQVFAAAPETAPDGQKYRRMVIFVTDGVANVLRNGMLNNYNGCSAETVACQGGTIPPGDPNGMPAPLQAMINEGQNLYQEYIQDTEGSVYIVALGEIEETGLAQVTNDSRLVLSAEDGDRLGEIFGDIQEDAVYGECKAAKGTRTDTMSANTVATNPGGFDGLTQSTVGYVYLTHNDSNQVIAPVEITADPQSRKLRYRVEELPPGTYTMKAFVGHRPVEDNTSRSYDLFVDTLPGADNVRVNVTSGAASLNGIVEYSFTLDLSKSVCGSEED